MGKVILGHQENVLEQFIFLIFALIMDESLLVSSTGRPLRGTIDHISEV